MRFALISGGTVIRAVELDPQWQTPNLQTSWTPPDGVTVVASDIAGVGWTYDGTNFTPPPSKPDPVPTANQLRLQQFLADPSQSDLLTRIQSATPAQIDTWLASNVTTLQQARTVLGAIIKVLAPLLSANN